MTRWGAPTSEGKPERSSEHWGCSIQEGGGSWGREDLGRHGVGRGGVPRSLPGGTGMSGAEAVPLVWVEGRGGSGLGTSEARFCLGTALDFLPRVQNQQ